MNEQHRGTVNRYPIVIPFKSSSHRCPRKNYTLFPVVHEWLTRLGVDPGNIYVVSASQQVENFVSYSGVNFVHEDESATGSDSAAVVNALDAVDSPVYIHLPLTQPVRDDSLIHKVVEAIEGDPGLDFATSFQYRTDRELFYLNSDHSSFISPSVNRKGSMCPRYPMIDGAIYAMRREFIRRIGESTDPNATFWSGRFVAVENDVPFFIDIDDPSDMQRYRTLP